MSQPIAVDLIIKNLAEGTEKAKERAQKASEVLLGPLETDIAPTPYEVVYQEDRVRLKHYIPEKVTHKIPLLVVYALINRETMLDLQPGRSTVQGFLDHGVEVYMIDWGYPTRKDRYVTIDDHVNYYMDSIVDLILKRHDLPKINLMGICMGGAFSVMYSALHPEKIKNLITTVTPTHFDTDKGLLHIWMKGLDMEGVADAFGNVAGDVMNLGFLLLNPARLMIDKYVGFLENVDDRTFVENFIRMEKWIFDSPDVPGETFRQFISDCYHKKPPDPEQAGAGRPSGGPQEHHHAALEHVRQVRSPRAARGRGGSAEQGGQHGRGGHLPAHGPHRHLCQLQDPEAVRPEDQRLAERAGGVRRRSSGEKAPCPKKEATPSAA